MWLSFKDILNEGILYLQCFLYQRISLLITLWFQHFYVKHRLRWTYFCFGLLFWTEIAACPMPISYTELIGYRPALSVLKQWKAILNPNPFLRYSCGSGLPIKSCWMSETFRRNWFISKFRERLVRFQIVPYRFVDVIPFYILYSI